MFLRPLVPALLASALLALPGAAQDASPVGLTARIYKSNGAGTKFTPLKLSKGNIAVVVRLYDGPVGAALEDPITGGSWAESFVVSAGQIGAPDPAAGAFTDPTKISGVVDLLLGSTIALPGGLLTKDVWYTTQVQLLKSGAVKKTYAESPRRPLGVAGHTRGRDLAPSSVTTDDVIAHDIEAVDIDAGAVTAGGVSAGSLTLANGAVNGHVLTSSAAGVASWKPLPDLPGLSGTTSWIPVFDSSNSIGDSSIEQLGDGSVKLHDSLSVTQDLFVQDHVSSKTLSASNSITTGQLTTGQLATGQLTVGQFLQANGIFASDGDFLALNGGTLSATSLTVGSVTVDDGEVTAPEVTVDDTLYVGGGSSQILLTQGQVIAPSQITGQVLYATDDLTVLDDATIGDDVTINGNLVVNGGTSVGMFSEKDIITNGRLIARSVIDTGPEGEEARLSKIYLWFRDESLDGEIRAEKDLWFFKNYDGGHIGSEFVWFENDNSGVGADMVMRLDAAHNLRIDGSFMDSGADVAEYLPTSDSSLAGRLGALVAVDPEHDEHVRLATWGVAESVLGIVSTQPGVLLGAGPMEGLHEELFRASMLAHEQGDQALADQLWDEWDALENARTDRVAIALAGRVPVLVDASGGLIRPGDRLGLGTTPGFAARYAGAGPVVGVALQAWDGRDEPIVAFVDLDWSPDATWQPSSGVASPHDAPAPAAQAGLQGEAWIPAGSLSVLVQHVGLVANDWPGITFLGDPGSRWWIEARGDGWFELALAAPAPRGVALGWRLAP